MSADYAIVLSASNGYLPGANATINAVDYYGSAADVHLITDEIQGDYFDRATQAGLPLIHVPLWDVCKKPESKADKTVKWCHMLGRYRYAASLAGRYAAVMLVDADCVLINNFDPWFRLAASSGMAFAPHNIFGRYDFPLDFPYVHTDGVPVANTPFIASPEAFGKVFERVWDLAVEHPILDLEALWFALRDMDRLKDVVLMPDNLWLNNHWYSAEIKPVTLDGRRYLYSLREPVCAFHKKWWRPGAYEGYTAKLAPWARKIAENNGKLFIGMLKLFNSQWKLKIPWTTPEPA